MVHVVRGRRAAVAVVHAEDAQQAAVGSEHRRAPRGLDAVVRGEVAERAPQRVGADVLADDALLAEGGGAAAAGGGKAEAAPAPKADPVPAKAEAAAPAPAKADPVPAKAASGDGRVKASPLARRLAAEKGIDLATVTGSGPNGRIVKADVEAISGEGRSAVVAPVLDPGLRRDDGSARGRKPAPAPPPVPGPPANLTPCPISPMSAPSHDGLNVFRRSHTWGSDIPGR